MIEGVDYDNLNGPLVKALINNISISVSDKNELVIRYLSDLSGYDFKSLSENLLVSIELGWNNKIHIQGDESILYELMVGIGNHNILPESRSPILRYTIDELLK